MFQSVRKTAVTVAALAAMAAGGAAVAGAADNGSSSGSSKTAAAQDEKALTGDTATKVKEAALAKVDGGTIIRVETDAQNGSAYEAHVRKADGTEVEVLVNDAFEVTEVKEMGDHGRGGHGGGRGGPGGGEEALTGATATKVEAAAKAKVPNGTVLRVETDANHGSAYEAHVRKADGTEVEVLVDKDFQVTDVVTQQRP
jgi:uncharacterized membrane protein YkoI